MSETDVRWVVRSALQSLADQGGELGETLEMAGALTELIRPYASADFECLMAPLPPTPPVAYPGIDGIERAWRDFGETFRSVSARLDRVVEGENAVVLLVEQTVVTDHGGVELTQPSALVVRFAGGQVEDVQFHLDQDAALRAGGLTPTDPDA